MITTIGEALGEVLPDLLAAYTKQYPENIAIILPCSLAWRAVTALEQVEQIPSLEEVHDLIFEELRRTE